MSDEMHKTTNTGRGGARRASTEQLGNFWRKYDDAIKSRDDAIKCPHFRGQSVHLECKYTHFVFISYFE